jgi:hypothetical protein
MFYREYGLTHLNKSYIQNYALNKPTKYDKGFLKPYYDIIRISENGYSLYCRRRNTFYCLFNRIIINLSGLNSRVIFYNLFLLFYFEAYINVEIYNIISAIKYVYKYVFKNHNLFYVTLEERNEFI